MSKDDYTQDPYDILNSTATETSAVVPVNLARLNEAAQQIKDNAFLPPLTGLKVVVDKTMNPNDCQLTVGEDFFKKLKNAIDENSKTQD